MSVRVGEGRDELARNRDGARDGEVALVGEHGGEGRAVDQLHRDVRAARGLAVIEDAYATAVVEPRDRAGLALEAELELAGEVRREDLDRDVLVEADVARAIDRSHPAPTEECEQLVAVGEARHV